MHAFGIIPHITWTYIEITNYNTHIYPNLIRLYCRYGAEMFLLSTMNVTAFILKDLALFKYQIKIYMLYRTTKCTLFWTLEPSFQMSIYPQTCQHVTVDRDSSMLSMENSTWGWRGVQQKMAQGKAVVVDSDWLIWFGVMDIRVESKSHDEGFAAITSGGSIRKYGSLTGFSFWWTLDRTPTQNPGPQ